LTDGIVWTRTLLTHPASTVSKIDGIKLDPQDKDGFLHALVDLMTRPHKVSTHASLDYQYK